MIIYFCDRQLNILGHASTTLPAGNRISQDKLVEDVESGVNSFECFITWDDNTRADLESAIVAGNYILKQSDTAYDSLYQIIETEADTKAQEIYLYAEDAGLDLLNTLCPASTLTGTIEEMLEYFLPDDWAVEIEDAPTTTLTNTWDGESTCTERIRSVVGLWGCELYYNFVIENLEVVSKAVNVTVKRGLQEAIPQLRLNYDIDRIVSTTSIANLVTALNVTGGTPEGSETPINLINYNYSYTDPVTGDVYQVHKPTGQMRNISAMERWSSALDQDGLWVGSYQFDTTEQAMLAGQARAELQKRSAPAVNYEVDFARLPEDAQIGDRVNIIDDEGELYLEARLLQIETCEAEQTKVATLGEYLLKTSGIAEKVAQIAEQVRQQSESDQRIREEVQILAETVGTMLTLEVESNIIAGQAHLKAHLYNGDTEVTTEHSEALYKWVLRKDTGEKLLGRGYTLNVNLEVMGYAGTILCRFIRPELYDLTDHNLIPITDQDGNVIQVSYAGLYAQPVVRRASKFKALNKASNTNNVLRTTPNETGYPVLAREVNLYERGNLDKELKDTLQYFWTEQNGPDAGAHITEVTKEEFLADPTNAGGNLLATSRGIDIRRGAESVASFADEGIKLGGPNGINQVMTNQSLEISTSLLKSLLKFQVDNNTDGTISVRFTFEASTSSTLRVGHLLSITSAEYADGTPATVTLSADGYTITVTNRQNKVLYVRGITDEPQPLYTLGTRVGNGGYYSCVFGRNCQAGGGSSFSAGSNNYVRSTATDSAILCGNSNEIAENIMRSVIMAGYENRISNDNAAVIAGYGNDVSGWAGVAAGYGSKAQGRSQFVIGEYNIAQGTAGTWTANDNVFIVGNGNTSARSNALALKYNGNMTIAGTLTQSSDRRLKDHRAYLGNEAIEFIRKLKPAHFRKDQTDHVGFYAQDVREADPYNCITGEMNGFLTMGYTELIAPLVAYCQSLEARISELENKED